jgi:hypothetical protein
MSPQGYPPQPGFPPGGPIVSRSRKGRGGLFAIIAIIVVVVLIVGVVGVLAFASKKPNGTNTTSSTPTTAPTPTPSVPAGFQKFSNTQFSVIYPSDWASQAGTGGGGENFTSTTGQLFQVIIQPGSDQSTVPTLLATLCSIFGKPIGSVTTVTIGGQPWQQETCGDHGVPVGTVEATIHQNEIFSIDYASLVGTYATDKTQFFAPMERSFAFAS